MKKELNAEEAEKIAGGEDELLAQDPGKIFISVPTYMQIELDTNKTKTTPQNIKQTTTGKKNVVQNNVTKENFIQAPINIK